jgi:hypothetical protein
VDLPHGALAGLHIEAVHGAELGRMDEVCGDTAQGAEREADESESEDTLCSLHDRSFRFVGCREPRLEARRRKSTTSVSRSEGKRCRFVEASSHQTLARRAVRSAAIAQPSSAAYET